MLPLTHFHCVLLLQVIILNLQDFCGRCFSQLTGHLEHSFSVLLIEVVLNILLTILVIINLVNYCGVHYSFLVCRARQVAFMHLYIISSRKIALLLVRLDQFWLCILATALCSI